MFTNTLCTVQMISTFEKCKKSFISRTSE